MAGPIKISILADAAQAVKSVTRFSDVVESETRRVVTTLGDSKLQGGFGKVQEGFDVADTRAMGFRDTLTGVQDTMRGFEALTTSTADATANVAEKQKAYSDAVAKFGRDSVQAVEAQSALAMAQEDLGRQQAPLIDKMFLLGTGVGDLASGMANFIVPLIAVGAGLTTMGVGTKLAAAGTKVYTGAQWLLNAALTANPIGLIVIGIAALVAGLVIAYKKSETFRRIVDGAFKGVLRAAQGAWNWVKANWSLLLAIITGPIGFAVRFVVKNFDAIVTKVKSIPGRIKGAFSGAKDILTGAGRAVIDGFTGAIQAKFKDVKDMLGRLTNLLPDWKGPASKDKRILTGPADLIMDGFLKRLESRYSDVRSSLGSFTDSLSGVGSTGRTAPLSAVPLLNSSSSSSSSRGTGTLRLVADGPTSDAAQLVVALLKEASRKGGGLKAMGVAV